MKDMQSVSEFCESNSISRAQLYKMFKAGTGPAVVKIGRRTLISREAAKNWRDSLPVGGPTRAA